jgi:hypothetical protein
MRDDGERTRHSSITFAVYQQSDLEMSDRSLSPLIDH